MRTLSGLALLLSLVAARLDAGGGAEVPQWFRDAVAEASRDGGVWIADNSRYRSSAEDYDSYGLEWRAGIGGTSLVGRLFGRREGREVATFWEFRQYWDPIAGEGRLQQFGQGGAFGTGAIQRLRPDTTLLDQVFVWPDGSRTRSGHLETRRGADERFSESFDIENGDWLARRTYSWRRLRSDAGPTPP
jgi:hypothetical protein